MANKTLPSPEMLTVAVAKDYPGAEILVSFPDHWQLIQRLQSSDIPRYVARFPSSDEKPHSDHFFGLPPEINRSLTIYRLYKLFEPWPTPLLRVVWDGVRNEGRVLDACRLRVQLQPVGQAQIWIGRRNWRPSGEWLSVIWGWTEFLPNPTSRLLRKVTPNF